MPGCRKIKDFRDNFTVINMFLYCTVDRNSEVIFCLLTYAAFLEQQFIVES